MPRNIAKDALSVGNALASVRIDQMILNLAKGIAWGQYELDKVGIDITRMMGAPGSVAIGGEKLSMLEAGFTPSFYHFVDSILELKMEVNIREEELKETRLKDQKSGSQTMTFNMENTTKAQGSVGYGPFSASVESELKIGFGYKNESAYLRSLDTTHSQKFSQDLSASSLMRTKLVPVPPPELLLERIRLLADRSWLNF